jgi:signal transduction histidine kinase
MGFSAAVSAMLELAMMTTDSPAIYNVLARWENLAVFMILVPMVWFIDQYFRTGRRWLAILITTLWSMGIVFNFISPGSLTFYQILELKRETIFWGEPFTTPVGEINQWKLLADVASFLILVYIVDATVRLWSQRGSEKAWIVGGAIVLFILVAGVHTPMVDAGLVSTPYMISFSYLAIVFALSYQVVMDAVRGARYKLELQRARRRLELYGRANLLGEYSVMLSHELNQPLTAILSNAQAALRYLDSDTPDMKEIRDIISDIARDDKRATETISRLRDMLKNDEVIRERFDLTNSIKEVINMSRGEFKEEKVHIIENYTSDNAQVYAGRIEIQLVILNLVANAVKATKKNSNAQRSLSISTHIINESVQVDIMDTGPGISSELHQSLFDRFVSDGKDGLGMGLPICRRIIESFDGRIWAENAETGGAIISFTLPLENHDGK